MTKTKHAGGRPSKYQDDFPEIAAGMCRMGATDRELANTFGVNVSTIFDWKHRYPLFAEALKNNKQITDTTVENALLKRAMGYEYEEEERTFSMDAEGKKIGTAKLKKTKKQVAPDVTAQIFWLKNRKRAEWRDVRSNEITGQDGAPLKTENVVVYIPSNGRVCTNEGE